MWSKQRSQALSIEELISQLEHIEESELRCDIRANVQAELKRMKRNVTAILRFLPNAAPTESHDSSELLQAILEVRRECLMINGTISRVLVLQALRLRQGWWEEMLSRATAQYGDMAVRARQLCQIAAPLHAQELMAAL